MDSPGSVERQESREDLALLVWQDSRDRRVTWGLQVLLVSRALWCRERV